MEGSSIKQCRFHFAFSLITGAVAVDETIYQYEPCFKTKDAHQLSRDPIPLAYIPRKPHPNGLLDYKLACKSAKTGLPYVIDFQPYLTPYQIDSPRASMAKLCDRWPYATKPHITADSAFGSVDVINQLGEKGFTVTMSMSTNECPSVWKLLGRSLQGNQWCAAGNGNGILFSCARDHHCRSFQHVATNAHHYDLVPDHPRAATQRTKEELMDMTVRQLKLVCLDEKIKSTGAKDVLVSRMLSVLNQPVSDVESVLKAFDEANQSGVGLPHSYYKCTFNSVDRHNWYWYQVKYGFAVRDWRKKMWCSVFTSGVVNAWVLCREVHDISLIDFRLKVSQDLMETCL